MLDRQKKDTIKITIPVNINFIGGLATGITLGVGFHPVDRALYLRGTDKLKDRQHLFAPKYWTQPMTGLRNTLYQRILSNGIYFTLQGELNTHLYPIIKNEWGWGDKQSKIGVGLIAGGVTGFVSNASYAVKFYTISHRPKGKPLENALVMWRQGGYRPFVNGIYAGVGRDGTFGILYEFSNLVLDEHIVKKLQNKVPEENTKTRDTIYLLSRFFSAGIATAASSPLNYARNMQFKTKPKQKQPHIFDIWCDAWRESSKFLNGSGKNAQLNQLSERRPIFPRLNFFRHKFMIGPGTIRAAAGMAIGQLLFDKATGRMRDFDEAAKQEKSINPKK